MNKNKGNIGPLVASILIVVVLLISGLYTLKNRPLKVETIEEPINNEIMVLDTQGTSTELEDIEEDLNLTDLEDLGSGLDMIESEL